MSGYRWDPVFRVVPTNGSETVYWLSDRLTDLGGHTRINLRYVESSTTREDINRSLRPIVFGLRPEVDIEFVIVTMSDHQFVSEIESALLQRKDYRVYLSLDGGVVEREVVLGNVSQAEPIRGKTVVGATFRLSLRCVDLITKKPSMMTDPGVGAEFVRDGGFDSWSSSSVLNSWTASGAVSLGQQSTAGFYVSAPYSAQIVRSDGVTFGSFGQNLTRGIKPGRWYRHRISHRGSISMALTGSGPFRIQIFNNQTQMFLAAADGKTWASTNGNYILAATETTFAQQESYFRIPVSGFNTEHDFTLRYAGYWAASESLYYDDASVYGPVLRPGYATW